MSGSFGFLVIGHIFHIYKYALARRSFIAAMVFWSPEAVGRGSPSSAWIVTSYESEGRSPEIQ